MFSIGADPEFFVQRHGVFVSAAGLVPGTKEAPHIVPNGAVQVDGLALEFNINPADNYEEFQNNLDVVLGILKGMIPGYEVLTDPAIILDPEYKASLPKEALIRGCSPDLNAYTEEANKTIPDDCDIHAAGGHIHIGGIFVEEQTAQQRYKMSLRLTRLLDKEVGVYSLLWDKDSLRRQVYGKAGSLRLKPYGMEYRTLSNAWLFNKRITKFVYDGAAKAVESLFRGEDVEDDYLRGIIDNSDHFDKFFRRNSTADYVKSLLA
jgi:hypothetical protein